MFKVKREMNTNLLLKNTWKHMDTKLIPFSLQLQKAASG